MADQVVSAIDLGSSKVAVVIGQIDRQHKLQILAAAQAPAFGMRRGGITNLDEAANSLTLALERASHLANVPVKTAYCAMTGIHIEAQNHRGTIAITPSDRDIDLEDVKRVLDLAGAIQLDPERQIIAVMPRTYIIDGQDGIKNPVGMSGHRLEVEAHIVTGAASAYRNLLKCATRARVEIEDLVLSALASAEAVLAPTEREMGAVLIDLGASTADVAIYADGGVWRTFMLPLGGQFITDDIAYGLRLPTPIAEALKCQFGVAIPAHVPEGELIELNQFLPTCQERIKRRDLANIIAPRVEEILTLIATEIKRSGRERLLAGGVVLTGGTADLAGMSELATEIFEAPVRIGMPHSLYGATSQMLTPAYSTAVGLLRWHQELQGSATNQGTQFGGWHDIWRTVRRFFGMQG